MGFIKEVLSLYVCETAGNVRIMWNVISDNSTPGEGSTTSASELTLQQLLKTLLGQGFGVLKIWDSLDF